MKDKKVLDVSEIDCLCQQALEKWDGMLPSLPPLPLGQKYEPRISWRYQGENDLWVVDIFPAVVKTL